MLSCLALLYHMGKGSAAVQVQRQTHLLCSLLMIKQPALTPHPSQALQGDKQMPSWAFPILEMITQMLGSNKGTKRA